MDKFTIMEKYYIENIDSLKTKNFFLYLYEIFKMFELEEKNIIIDKLKNKLQKNKIDYIIKNDIINNMIKIFFKDLHKIKLLTNNPNVFKLFYTIYINKLLVELLELLIDSNMKKVFDLLLNKIKLINNLRGGYLNTNNKNNNKNNNNKIYYLKKKILIKIIINKNNY